jgi:hypothetical protein
MTLILLHVLKSENLFSEYGSSTCYCLCVEGRQKRHITNKGLRFLFITGLLNFILLLQNCSHKFSYNFICWYKSTLC